MSQNDVALQTFVRGRRERHCAFVFALVLLLPATSGCGSSPDSRVQGVVTLDGKPLALAAIAFVPEKKGVKMAGGTSDESGVFRVATHGRKDVLPGRYKIIIIASPGRPSVPEIYADPKRTPLAVELPTKAPVELRLVAKH